MYWFVLYDNLRKGGFYEKKYCVLALCCCMLCASSIQAFATEPSVSVPSAVKFTILITLLGQPKIANLSAKAL